LIPLKQPFPPDFKAIIFPLTPSQLTESDPGCYLQAGSDSQGTGPIIRNENEINIDNDSDI